MAKAKGSFQTPTIDIKIQNPDLFITVYQQGSKYAWRLRTGSNRLPKLCRYIVNTEDFNERIYLTDTSNFKEPEKFIQEAYETINNAISMGAAEDRIIEEIKNLGFTLYDRLFPAEVKRIYWEYLAHHNGDRKINLVIKSSEPWIPWEIVRPYNRDLQEEDVFLCEKFNLTRWIANTDMQDVIKITPLRIIATSGLRFAQEEVSKIQALLQNEAIAEEITLPQTIALLKEGGFSGLHFICHGTYNTQNPERSELFLNDGCLRPIDINGDKTFFAVCKPFVFINACETGQSSYALTGIGGWTDAFLRRGGSSAFVGSMWEADDELACFFAYCLYRLLLSGKPIAEAVRLARMQLKERDPLNPTWLSYTVYASPMAQVLGTSGR